MKIQFFKPKIHATRNFDIILINFHPIIENVLVTRKCFVLIINERNLLKALRKKRVKVKEINWIEESIARTSSYLPLIP